MSKDGDIVWSTDEETFNYDEKYEAVDALYSYVDGKYIPAQVGDKIYYGTAVALDVSNLIDADDIIEMLGERAWDNCGEFADGYPDVSKKERDLLDNYLKRWVKKYCKPTFYNVKDIKEYVITEEDIKEMES